MSKKKSKFRTQANGRERGIAGNGDGAFNEVMPVTHVQIHKGKRDIKNREDKRDKQKGWGE